MDNQTVAIATNQPVNIDQWLANREEYKTKVAAKMVEGIDYHVIQGKKSLGKPGAEKIQSILNLTTDSAVDEDTLKALSNPEDVIAYRTEVFLDGKKITDGRGARSVKADNGDFNKAIKMAMKSSHIDAILRASGLSDIFTQDIEDMNPAYISAKPVYKPKMTSGTPARNSAAPYPASDKQLEFIEKLCQQVGGPGNGFENTISEYVDEKYVDYKNLSIKDASALIDKLLKVDKNESRPIEDEMPTI